MERHQIVVPRLLCGGHTGRFWGKFKDEKTEAHFMSFFGNYIVWGNRPLIPFVLHLVATLVVFGVPSGEGGLEVGGVGEVGEGGDFYFSAFSHLHIFVTAATTLLYFIVERYRSNDFDEFLNGPMSVMYTGVFWATWTLFVKDNQQNPQRCLRGPEFGEAPDCRPEAAVRGAHWAILGQV